MVVGSPGPGPNRPSAARSSTRARTTRNAKTVWSPTSLSLQLAQAWGVTLIGYTRRRSFRVYTGVERVVATDESVGD